MKKTIMWCAVGLLAIKNSAYAALDPNVIHITRKELEKRIASTPLSSESHYVFLNRAATWKLNDSAYSSYSRLARQNPDDGYASLWLGMASLKFWWDTMTPGKLYATDLSREQLFKEAKENLRKAHFILPRNADIQAEYGFFEWQYDNRLAQGFARCQKAVRMNPKSYRAHILLGSIYANPSAKSTYQPVSAIRGYRLASHLSPTSSAPYQRLSSLYMENGRYKESQTMFNKYLSLIPKSFWSNAKKSYAKSLRYYQKQSPGKFAGQKNF